MNLANFMREIEATGLSVGVSVANLAIGNPDLPPHPDVLAAAGDALTEKDASLYQNGTRRRNLKSWFARFYRKRLGVTWVKPENVLPIQGAKDGIALVRKLVRPTTIAVPDLGYFAYGADMESKVETFDFHLPTDENSVSNVEVSRVCDADLVWVNYPNMPTGVSANTHFLNHLLATAAQQRATIVVNDNPYAMLFDDPFSIFQLGNSEECLEVTSLSKSHNMAGWRIGAVIGNKKTIDRLEHLHQTVNSGMFYPLEQAARVALNLPESWYKNLRATYCSRRISTEAFLKVEGCEIADGQCGMFVWAKIPNSYSCSIEFTYYLLKEFGILVAPGECFGNRGKGHVRVSLTSQKSLLELIE